MVNIKKKFIDYKDGENLLEGFMAWDEDANESRPGILVGHAWAGRSKFECSKAEDLAKLGYVGFALDVYGKGIIGKNKEENAKLMTPFIEDRSILQRRLQLALNTLKEQNEVDANKVASIGYCFGGLMSLDLARINAEIHGAVSFHGILSNSENTSNDEIKSRILVLHGWDDPMVPPDSVIGFTEEMKSRKADWQLHAFGGAMHAFTKKDANDPEHGMQYHKASDKRSWLLMQSFLEELFG